MEQPRNVSIVRGLARSLVYWSFWLSVAIYLVGLSPYFWIYNKILSKTSEMEGIIIILKTPVITITSGLFMMLIQAIMQWVISRRPDRANRALSCPNYRAWIRLLIVVFIVRSIMDMISIATISPILGASDLSQYLDVLLASLPNYVFTIMLLPLQFKLVAFVRGEEPPPIITLGLARLVSVFGASALLLAGPRAAIFFFAPTNEKLIYGVANSLIVLLAVRTHLAFPPSDGWQRRIYGNYKT